MFPHSNQHTNRDGHASQDHEGPGVRRSYQDPHGLLLSPAPFISTSMSLGMRLQAAPSFTALAMQRQGDYLQGQLLAPNFNPTAISPMLFSGSLTANSATSRMLLSQSHPNPLQLSAWTDDQILSDAQRALQASLQPGGLSANNPYHLQQTFYSSSGFFRGNHQGLPLQNIHPGLGASFHGMSQLNGFATGSTFLPPNCGQHNPLQLVAAQSQPISAASTATGPADYKICECGARFPMDFRRSICPDCKTEEERLRIERRRREREITKDNSPTHPSCLTIIRQRFLTIPHRQTVFNPDKFIYKLDMHGNCGSQYISSDGRQFPIGCDNLKFSLEWFLHVPSFAQILAYKGIHPKAKNKRTQVKYHVLDEEGTGTQLVKKWEKQTPSSISPLTDTVGRVSLSAVYPFNAALNRLKADCIRLLRDTPLLFKGLKKKHYKDWDDDMYLAALFALMELHPSKLTQEFTIMVAHTDKNKVGAVCFFCFSGASFNFFCVKGGSDFDKEVGDYSIYLLWKESLSPEELARVKNFEEDLFKTGKGCRVVVVHFTSGKRVMFDPGHTVHAVIVLGIRHHNFLKKEPKDKEAGNTRCIGVMYGCNPKRDEDFTERHPVEYGEQTPMEAILRDIMAPPKDWHQDLPATKTRTATGTNEGPPEEEYEPPLVIFDDVDSEEDSEPTVKKQTTSNDPSAGAKSPATETKSTASEGPKRPAAATNESWPSRKQTRRSNGN